MFVLVGVAALLYYNKRSKDKLASQQVKMAASVPKDLLLDVYVVKPADISNTLDATGSLMGNESVDLQPQVGGMVTLINFKEGSIVQKGDTLIKMFDADLKAQLEKSRMAHQLAQLTLDREEKLLAVNGVAQQDVDNAQNAVQSNQADMDNLQAQIAKTEITAPFTGVIGLRNVSVGATVASTTVIATLVQTDPLKMDFSIPEKYENTLTKGDSVLFTVTEVPGRKFIGKIYAVEPDIDVATRTVRIRSLVENPNNLLHPGSFTNVHLEMKNITNALMVPTEAIMQSTRDKQVVVIKNHVAQITNVETGVTNADKIQITNGLQPYDTVAITGIMQVKPGIQVSYLSIQ